ncbi:MAG: hypothetical protein CXT67_09710 [Methanobacteriota archaeon]|nr:MAG: hypothetical protein CXT67_09710 [Euryarchaeota archaeon]
MDELNERFEEFHSQNPRFYNLFNSFTYHLIGKGFRNYSAKCIFERIRWETDQANSEGQSDFKVNNNFASFYSRLWMEKNQKYSGFFRIRAQPSADKDPTKLPELKPNDFPTE